MYQFFLFQYAPYLFDIHESFRTTLISFPVLVWNASRIIHKIVFKMQMKYSNNSKAVPFRVAVLLLELQYRFL